MAYGRFTVVEHFNGYAVLDRKTRQKAWMSDGVDCLFTLKTGKALTPGSEYFRRVWTRDLNKNQSETLEAYFPEQYEREGE